MSNTTEFPTAPDWSKAPKEAQYFAIDKIGGGGVGWWYLEEPHVDFTTSTWGGPIIASAGRFDATDWQNSLQKRPELIWVL